MGTQIALALSLSVLLNGSSTAQKLAHKVATIILEYVISSADNYAALHVGAISEFSWFPAAIYTFRIPL